MDNRKIKNTPNSHQSSSQRRRPLRDAAVASLARIASCDSEGPNSDDSNADSLFLSNDSNVENAEVSLDDQHCPRHRKRSRKDAFNNQSKLGSFNHSNFQHVLLDCVTNKPNEKINNCPIDCGRTPARRKIFMNDEVSNRSSRTVTNSKDSYSGPARDSCSLHLERKALGNDSVKKPWNITADSPATIVTKSSSSKIDYSVPSLTSISQDTTKLHDKTKRISTTDSNQTDELPTCTVVVPSAVTYDDVGLDADIKRALKLSLQTYAEETSTRQLLMEAEYSLARSQFGKKPSSLSSNPSIKSSEQNISSIGLEQVQDIILLDSAECAQTMMDEEAFKKAKMATLARMECSSMCSSSSATITVASSTSSFPKDSITDAQDKSIRLRTQSTLPPFSQKDFEKLWSTSLLRLGFKSVEEIESGNFLRNANTSFKDGKIRSLQNVDKNNTILEDHKVTRSNKRSNKSEHLNIQTRAMYGRTNFGAMKKIIDMTNLTQSDIFLDIGHGIGNACLQVAFTVGCEARGIEVVPQRCMISKFLTETMVEQLDEVAHAERDRKRKIGRIELREGSVVDPAHKSFLLSADVVLVNNSHDIFGVRSGDFEGRPTVDSYVAGIFAQLKPGARMVTFYPLLSLGRSLSEENERRRKNGMEESLDASFFTSEYRSLGKDAVSWSYVKEINVYLYTRVKQSSLQGEAIFLCSNKKCPFGNSNGTAAVDDKTGLLHEECVYCGTKRTVKTRR